MEQENNDTPPVEQPAVEQPAVEEPAVEEPTVEEPQQDNNDEAWDEGIQNNVMDNLPNIEEMQNQFNQQKEALQNQINQHKNQIQNLIQQHTDQVNRLTNPGSWLQMGQDYLNGLSLNPK